MRRDPDRRSAGRTPRSPGSRPRGHGPVEEPARDQLDVRPGACQRGAQGSGRRAACRPRDRRFERALARIIDLAPLLLRGEHERTRAPARLPGGDRRTHPGGIEHEILVLDNASDDGSAEAVRELAPGGAADRAARAGPARPRTTPRCCARPVAATACCSTRTRSWSPVRPRRCSRRSRATPGPAPPAPSC